MKLTKSGRRCLLVFLGVMSAIAPLATDMYLPALPTMQHDFGINASLAQLTLTMTMIGMAIGQIFAGPISDMLGRKYPLLAGMSVFTLATVGCVFSQNIYLFLLFRFIMGFAGSAGIVISKAIARDVCEGVELTRFFAILMMVNGLAPIIAPVIGGQILLLSQWRGVFVALVAVGIGMCVATLIYQETLQKEKRIKGIMGTFKSFPQLLKDRYFMGHCLVQCFFGGAFFSYLSGSSFVFQNIYGVSAQVYSLIFGGIGAGLMLIGMLPARLAGRVPDVVMLRHAVRVSFVGSLFLLAAFLSKASLLCVLPILFITIVPMSVMGAASFSLALSRQGKNAGGASALIGFFSMILGGMFMPLVGIMGDHNALPMCILMIFGYGMAVISFYKFVAPEHQ